MCLSSRLLVRAPCNVRAACPGERSFTRGTPPDPRWPGTPRWPPAPFRARDRDDLRGRVETWGDVVMGGVRLDQPGAARQVLDDLVVGDPEPGLTDRPFGILARLSGPRLGGGVHHPVHGLLVVAGERPGRPFGPLQHGPRPWHARGIAEHLEADRLRRLRDRTRNASHTGHTRRIPPAHGRPPPWQRL